MNPRTVAPSFRTRLTKSGLPVRRSRLTDGDLAAVEEHVRAGLSLADACRRLDQERNVYCNPDKVARALRSRPCGFVNPPKGTQ